MKRSAAPSNISNEKSFIKRPVNSLFNNVNQPSQKPEETPLINQKEEATRKFSVVYSKPSTRVHKKWENDGEFICYDNRGILKSEDGQNIGTKYFNRNEVSSLEEGQIFIVGKWEMKLIDEIGGAPKFEDDDIIPLPQPSRTIGLSKTTSNSSTNLNIPISNLRSEIRSALRPSNGTNFSSSSPSLVKEEKPSSSSNYAHDENASCASELFILNQDQVSFETAVIVDPKIARHLRAHQREGIQFMYDKLKNSPSGVILADDMGLGKTIQTIALIYTLLNNGPDGKPIFKKVLLIVPTSLIQNWIVELNKWIEGKTIHQPVESASEIDNYVSFAHRLPILIISYGMAWRHIERLEKIRFDLMVCDEAHQLKGNDSKLRKKLSSLDISRKLLLSGTPLQNDVEEFYSILDFARPTVFGSLAEFKAQIQEKEGIEMPELVDETLLRRKTDVIKEFMPQKTEYIIFCKPSEIQRHVYEAISDVMTLEAFSQIDLLKKLCNHPALVHKSVREGKLAALLEMVMSFYELGEKTVIASSYTKTLDLLEELFSFIHFKISRLDGQTPNHERQKIVEKFNSSKNRQNLFLLSTKAGGIGLNLTGASRLILFDSSWNPAIDLQAMARIWREGQQKKCHIYRLITSGTIEEKILQRQIMKTGLTSLLEPDFVDADVPEFIDEEMQDFTLVETECETHTLIGCECRGSGALPDELDALENENHGEMFEEEINDTSLRLEESSFLDESKPCIVGIPGSEHDDSVLDGYKMDLNESSRSYLEQSILDDSVREIYERGEKRKKKMTKQIEEDLAISSEAAIKLDSSRKNEKHASMAELLRWRHYSTAIPQALAYVKTNTGLSRIEPKHGYLSIFEQVIEMNKKHKSDFLILKQMFSASK